MHTAFEVTEDDVKVVIERESCINRLTAVKQSLGSVGKDTSDIFDELDFDAIENAALKGDDLDTQTCYAHDEIEDQIVKIIADWHQQ